MSSAASRTVGLTDLLDAGRCIAGLLDRAQMEAMVPEVQKELEDRYVWITEEVQP